MKQEIISKTIVRETKIKKIYGTKTFSLFSSEYEHLSLWNIHHYLCILTLPLWISITISLFSL